MNKTHDKPITWGYLIGYVATRTHCGSDFLFNDKKFINFIERCADSGIGGTRLLDIAVGYVQENR